MIQDIPTEPQKKPYRLRKEREEGYYHNGYKCEISHDNKVQKATPEGHTEGAVKGPEPLDVPFAYPPLKGELDTIHHPRKVNDEDHYRGDECYVSYYLSHNS